MEEIFGSGVKKFSKAESADQIKIRFDTQVGNTCEKVNIIPISALAFYEKANS